jgi:hypothetical protein
MTRVASTLPGSEATVLMNPGHPADTLHRTRPDPVDLVRRANAGITVELEASRRRETLARGSDNRGCQCERRLEAIEAAIFTIYALVDGAYTMGAYGAEHADSIHA